MGIWQRIREALFGSDMNDVSDLYTDTSETEAIERKEPTGATLAPDTIFDKKEVESTKSKAKFVIFKGENDEYYFRLKAPNGKIIASGEGYTDKRGAQRGIAAIKKYALKAIVEELE